MLVSLPGAALEHRVRFRFSVLLPFAFSLLSLTASAAPSTLGKQRYEEGERAFNARRWDDARRAFGEAYELDREPELLYDVALATFRAAQASHDAADLRAARAAYQRYLAAAPAGRSRAQAESSVRTIDALLATSPADGSAAGTSASTSSATAAVESPSHASSAAEPSSHASPESPERSTGPAARASSAAPADAAVSRAMPTYAPAGRADLTHPAPVRTPLYKRWWLWTTVGVVVAGAGVGLYFGLTANRFSPTLPDFGPGSAGGATPAVRP
jgi:hypothetical protein